MSQIDQESTYVSMDPARTRERPHVVVVGAGFGGLEAAGVLKDRAVDVTLVDRNNYHKFQPLLYEVAMSGMEPDDIAHTVRDLFRNEENVRFRHGTVLEVDRDERRLRMRSGPDITYDYLILAAGAETEYFGVEGAEEYGYPLKNIPDAVNLRNHVLRQFERFDRDTTIAPEGALTFVIVGAGATGVETAGAFTELFVTLEKDYHTYSVQDVARVVLIDMLDDVLLEFDEDLRRYARKVLSERGVDIRLSATVERVEEGAVILESGDRIPTQTLIWAAGVRGAPLADHVGTEQAKNKTLKVEEDLRLLGEDRVFAIGDMAGSLDEEGEPHPGMAPVAVQQGRHAARQALRLLDGKPTEAFRYEEPGKMATIGRRAAVVELSNGTRLTGLTAWVLWAIVHIAKIPGLRNKLRALTSWTYNHITGNRNVRLILDVVPIPADLPYEPEEVHGRLKGTLRRLEERAAEEDPKTVQTDV